MENKKENIIVTNNGIRIKGNVSAFSQYNHDRQSSSEKAKKEKKRAKKEKEEQKKVVKQKVNKKVETKAERRRKAAAKKRIEKYHQRMAASKTASHSSFEVLQKKEWILDWNYVMFKNGYMVIYAHSTSSVRFRPLKTYVSGSLESFNYLKKYLNERLPPVRCEIVGLELRIIDEIHFNEAIQQFALAARQGVIKVKRNASNVNASPLPMSFSQAMSKARQMTPEEFKKYKSKYIDYLVVEQSKEYKIVPCAERLAHTTGDTTEFAFLFSIPCGNDKVMIVHENVNPDRSTLLFLVRREEFQKSIRAIYDFLQSPEINKRSSLRSRDLEIDSAMILRYKSINHDNYSSWKQTIYYYKHYYWG